MSTQYTANQADFVRAQNGTETAANSIKTIITNLESQLTQLTHSPQYQGEQQVAFVNAHNKAQEVGQALQRDLMALQQILNDAHGQYASADAAQAGSIGAVSNMDPASMGNAGSLHVASSGGLGITAAGSTSI
jgi:hypothetical protein